MKADRKSEGAESLFDAAKKEFEEQGFQGDEEVDPDGDRSFIAERKPLEVSLSYVSSDDSLELGVYPYSSRLFEEKDDLVFSPDGEIRDKNYFRFIKEDTYAPYAVVDLNGYLRDQSSQERTHEEVQEDFRSDLEHILGSVEEVLKDFHGSEEYWSLDR